MRTRLRDLFLELRIWWLREHICACRSREVMRVLWREYAALVAQRSPQQVRRIEARKGLL